jgi:hypothetical protein
MISRPFSTQRSFQPIPCGILWCFGILISRPLRSVGVPSCKKGVPKLATVSSYDCLKIWTPSLSPLQSTRWKKRGVSLCRCL